MMCCDLLSVREQLNMMQESRIDLLHMDIMDGSFVPNIALGACFVEQLKKGTRLPLDIHFMIDSPERYINTYPISEGDYVSIHFESTNHVQRALQAVKNKGAKALVAINPATPIYAVIEVLDDIDGVLIMSVNPGYAGQKMIPRSIEKIKAMRKFLDENGRPDAEIEVDGNVSIENAIKMRTAGANILVLGTAMQSKKESFSAEDIKRFKETVK
jgi:ribulose-phosphate 3-epimerase